MPVEQPEKLTNSEIPHPPTSQIPDLLKHYAPVTRKSTPVAYAAPDWFLHHSSPPSTNEPRKNISTLPDYMIHKEFNDDHHSSNYETRRGPFDFDTKSVWQRDAEDKENTEKKKVKLPAINAKYPSRTANVCMNKEFSGKNKLSFPPMPAQRKGEPVNFSKLISNGYGTDWLLQHIGCGKKIQDTSEDSKKSQDSEPSQSESAPASSELKPEFQECKQ
ncbi:uncharacterized protein C7orf57 homolog isoform X3 [Meleagris gallopavo]|uniref:uncharacterized protein C7orf57 homolog isoform X3 n=1 Tax=Meleagris gallopavo TaxID=9103 RepID=UPI00093CFABE|nr:uncharacterized protein C7orf57 homolog isoform X3 [Meleagris gallopavo]